MLQRSPSIILGFLCILPGMGVCAPGAVALGETTPYTEEGTPQNVRQECHLDVDLPKHIESYAKDYGIDVILLPGTPDTRMGRVLKLKIIGTEGLGGGGWSGSKAVKVTGELYENGKVTGSFFARRQSTGGLFGGLQGTCDIMQNCTRVIGKDISKWLRKPSTDARLGDL